MPKYVERTIEHAAYDVYRYTNDEGEDIYSTIECGDWHDGEMALCAECKEDRMEDYPQGWAHYPGDICPHGRYTGGSGIDWMCHYCEMGETEPYLVHRFRVMFTIGDMSPMEMKPYVRYANEGADERTVQREANDHWAKLTLHLITKGRAMYVTPEIQDMGITTYVVADSMTEWRVPSA